MCISLTHNPDITTLHLIPNLHASWQPAVFTSCCLTLITLLDQLSVLADRLTAEFSFHHCLNLTIAWSAFDPEVAVGIPVVVDPLTDFDSTQPAYVCLAHSTPERQQAASEGSS